MPFFVPSNLTSISDKNVAAFSNFPATCGLPVNDQLLVMGPELITYLSSIDDYFLITDTIGNNTIAIIDQRWIAWDNDFKDFLYSDDEGFTWDVATDNTAMNDASSIKTNGSVLVAVGVDVGDNAEFAFSTDQGETWNSAGSIPAFSTTITFLPYDSQLVYSVTDALFVAVVTESTSLTLVTSSDGNTWTKALTEFANVANNYTTLAEHGGTYYFQASSKLYKMTDISDPLTITQLFGQFLEAFLDNDVSLPVLASSVVHNDLLYASFIDTSTSTPGSANNSLTAFLSDDIMQSVMGSQGVPCRWITSAHDALYLFTTTGIYRSLKI